MKKPELILASGSPRRAEILSQEGYQFQIAVAEVQEAAEPQLSPRELALLNAYRKARAIAKRYPDKLVLGADTVVALEGCYFGKPRTLDEARQFLRTLSGRTHQVVTGVCLIQQRIHRQKLFVDVTDVTFKKLSEKEIDEYLATIDPLDKAGGYAIQEQGDRIVAEVHGSRSNVIGLPLEKLEQALSQLG